MGKRTVLVPAENLVTKSGAAPMKIDDYVWSGDNKQLLIFTNTKKVWRLNTRGDYWVLDLTSGNLKNGGGAPESSLMFAKFSPDGRSVAFVRVNNIDLRRAGHFLPHTQPDRPLFGRERSAGRSRSLILAKKTSGFRRCRKSVGEEATVQSSPTASSFLRERDAVGFSRAGRHSC